MSMLIQNNEQQISGFTRCAVCKVDFRGRFVFVDEQAEEILGASKEELIGRPLVDFMDETSRSLVVSLFARRNHYESFFDAVSLTVSGRHGKTTTTTTIVSLNFIAGNPVNFQFIFTPVAPAEHPVPTNRKMFAEELCVELLAEQYAIDWQKRLNLLLTYTGASQALLYATIQGSPELRGIVQKNSESDTPFSLAPGTTELHAKVAESGLEFVFTDPGQYINVFESVEDIPYEYVRVITIGDEPSLLRLVWESEIDTETARESVQRARFAALLLDGLSGRSVASNIATAPDDLLRLVVSSLEAADVGACQIGEDGRIVNLNTALRRHLRRIRPNATYLDIAKTLSPNNSLEIEHAFVNWFGAKTVHNERPLRCEFELPGGKPCLVHAVRLSHLQYDYSALLLFVPVHVETMAESVA